MTHFAAKLGKNAKNSKKVGYSYDLLQIDFGLLARNREIRFFGLPQMGV